MKGSCAYVMLVRPWIACLFTVGFAVFVTGTKSEDIQEGVLRILRDLCGEDDDLLLHICDSIELIDSDGACDEQKSLRLVCEIFPHARFLCRDATHSARRLTRNPWSADLTSVRSLRCTFRHLSRFAL